MKTGRKSWFGQRAIDVASKGKSAAPWIVFWNDPDTGKRKEKSCGAGKNGWRLAKAEADRMHVAIVSGTYTDPKAAKGNGWDDFWSDYQRDVLSRLSPHGREATRQAVKHFVRLVEPTTVSKITTKTIDQFTAARREEKRGEQKISPATVNKELRHLRVVVRKAYKWGMMKAIPDFTFEREIQRDPTYCTAEHFKALYEAADAAEEPAGRPYSPGDWWRALLTTLYMTGWRIGETLALKRDDIDFDAGVAKLHAETTKGRRDAVIKLHPVVIEHLQKIRDFGDRVFDWRDHRRALYVELEAIQKQAGLADCPYGFHDLRRAFATMNAANLSAPALQALMRHQAWQTTAKYINAARQLDATSVSVLHVPDVLRPSVATKSKPKSTKPSRAKTAKMKSA